MKTKFFAALIVLTFALNGAGATVFAAPKTKKKNVQTNPQQLAALLPASDGAMTFNVQKAFSTAMPQILSGNQLILADILGKIDSIKTQTGIDLRQFEQIAVGVATRRSGAARELDFEPVVLARGKFAAR